MVPCAPVISIIVWKCSIHYASLTAMFSPLHSSMNRESTCVTKVATVKYEWCCTHQLTFEKRSIHHASLSARFNSLHSSINQVLFKKHICNESNRYEKYGWFSLHKGSHHMYHQTDAFCCRQRWMENKENTCKPMKNALYILQYTKRHLLGWSSIEQWKNQASSLSCYRVTLLWRH